MALASTATCFCWDFVRVRKTTLRAVPDMPSRAPARETDVFPVPVPDSRTTHLPPLTESLMRRIMPS